MPKIKQETYRQEKLKINGQVEKIMFYDTEPNSCVFQNTGDCNIYVSRSPMVSTEKYECVIYPKATQKFIKPRRFRELYFFSTKENVIDVESFYTEDLTPKDLQTTEIINFLQLDKPITLGNVEEIIKPVNVKDLEKYFDETNSKRTNDIKNIPIQNIINAINNQNIKGIIDSINNQDIKGIIDTIKNKNVDLNPIITAIKNNAPKDIKIDFSPIVTEIKGLRQDLEGVKKFMGKIVYTADGEVDLSKINLGGGTELVDTKTGQKYQIIVENGKPYLEVKK